MMRYAGILPYLFAVVLSLAYNNPVSAFNAAGFRGAFLARAGGRRAVTYLSPKMGLFDGLFGSSKTEEQDVLSRNFQPDALGVWEEYVDEASKKKYYYNSNTQETLWEDEFAKRSRASATLSRNTLPKQPEFTTPVIGRATKSVQPIPYWAQDPVDEKQFKPLKFGGELEAERLTVAWRQGGGGMMQKGGFGFVFTGTYDARSNAAASRRDLKIVVKLPTTDGDAVRTFQSETEINKKLSSYGRLPGVAEFVGTVDLRPIERQLPSGLGSKTGLVWVAVQGKTLDTFFDRGGGMSPILASTLGVKESPPTRTAQGEVVYIKVELCRRVLGESLLPLFVIHDKGIIHRDMKPKNIMLVEGDRKEPFRIIDFGSAVEKGKNPVMDDSTEIYAPPEAPNPDRSNPEGYDIYALGITALRVLMPSMIAGESGIQCLGMVTTKELPDFDYDVKKWCEARAKDNASKFQFKPLNAECRALLRHPELLSLISDMLSKDPKKRPSAAAALQRLGPEWAARLADLKAGRVSRGVCGTCSMPVYADDPGRVRDGRGVYFHAQCMP